MYICVCVSTLEIRHFILTDPDYYKQNSKLNSVALVREQTIPTERPPPVGEVSANFCG